MRLSTCISKMHMPHYTCVYIYTYIIVIYVYIYIYVLPPHPPKTYTLRLPRLSRTRIVSVLGPGTYFWKPDLRKSPELTRLRDSRSRPKTSNSPFNSRHRIRLWPRSNNHVVYECELKPRLRMQNADRFWLNSNWRVQFITLVRPCREHSRLDACQCRTAVDTSCWPLFGVLGTHLHLILANKLKIGLPGLGSRSFDPTVGRVNNWSPGPPSFFPVSIWPEVAECQG